MLFQVQGFRDANVIKSRWVDVKLKIKSYSIICDRYKRDDFGGVTNNKSQKQCQNSPKFNMLHDISMLWLNNVVINMPVHWIQNVSFIL